MPADGRQLHARHGHACGAAALSLKPDLRRALGTFSGTLVAVGAMVGSGIYSTPHDVARAVRSPGVFLLLWLVGGGTSLLGALTFAELGASRPRTGGLYVYLREAFGPLASFLFGWAMLAVLVPSSVAYFAQITAAYVAQAAHVPAVPVGVAVIVGVCAGNVVRGARGAAFLSNVVTLVKYAGLALLAAAGLMLVRGGSRLLVPGPAHGTAIGAVAALVPVLWAYDGWIDVTSIAGEMREPARSVPRSLLFGTLLVTAAYLACCAAYLAVLGLDGLAATSSPAAAVGARLLGETGRAAATALVAISTFGCCAVSLMTGARVVYAMGADGSLLRALGRTGPSGGPDAAVVVTSVLALAYLLAPPLGTLAATFVIGAWPFYALGALGLPLLRRRAPSRVEPDGSVSADLREARFRVPGYPWTVLVFAASSLAIVAAYAWTETLHTAVSFGVIALGAPVYWLIRRSRRRTT